MKYPLSWISEYVDLSGMTAEKLAEKLVHIGFEVEEIIDKGAGIFGVVAGRIVSLQPHPDAEKLQIALVDVGKKRPVCIVTNAKNVAGGDVVPVALHGATLLGGKSIQKGSFRGVMSEGMFCGRAELGADDSVFAGADGDGVIVLAASVVPGADVKDALGLGEIILDVSITANRPDCQSVYGLSREIAVMLGREIKPLNLSYKTKSSASSRLPVPATIEDFSLCPRYTGRIIENIRIAESPDWLKRRLRLYGQRPINNIVDITNYVLLEVGHPLHAFDIRCVNQKITVRRAKEGEKAKLLNGCGYTLTDSMLVVSDEDKVLAVAGVMGGESSGIATDTQTVFLESARFARGSVRQTSRALSLKSDSSARFEKGVDYFSVDAGRERALALMCELGVGDILDTVCDCSVPLPKNKTVNTSAAQISNVLGIKIPGEKIIQILSPLGFKARVRGDKMSVSVPQWREDIDAYPDLAEEVIRFYGYDKIKPTMFCAGLVAVGGYPERDKKLFAVKAAMQGFGAREIITYSFLNPKVFDMLKMPAGDGLRKAIPVTNPLSEEFSVMRTELASSMLNAVKLNVSRRNDAFRLFEIGRAYKAAALPLTPTNMPSENETLCIAYVGKDEDFYKLKSAAAELLSNLLKVKEVSFFPTDCPWLHPGIGAKVAAGFTSDKGANRIELGNIGKIHPEVAKSFEVPEGTYIAEICLESLISHTMPDIRYKCLPKFPAVDRDLAVLVKSEITVGSMIDCIKSAAGELCERVGLFDIYSGAQIESGFKSVAFSIRLQSQDKTLSDAEIQGVMSRVVAALEEKFSAKLR